jgi:hypothetical protein
VYNIESAEIGIDGSLAARCPEDMFLMNAISAYPLKILLVF